MALLPSLLISSIELCQFAIVTVTVPFYLFLWYFMIKAQFRKFDELATPFFKLCISTAIIDLSTLFANYFGVMFPKFGFFNDFYIYLDAIYAHIYLYIAWSTGICQAMCVSVLATNRLSAMLLPGSYHKMWQSKRLWIAISVQFLPGMLVGLLTFFNKTQLAINEKNGLVPVFLDDLFASINPYLLWIFSDSLRKYVLYQVGLRKHLSVNNTAMITKSAMVNRRPSVAVYN